MYIAEKDFKPQLKIPKDNDKYYNTSSNGGINPCRKGRPIIKKLDVLCNCVGYEVGRFNSETQEEKCLFFGSMNAKSFYAYALKWGLPTGQEPKVGACACWDGGKSKKGHVANVEEVDKKTGDCSLSSSGFEAYKFKLQKKCNKKNNYGMSSSYKFLAFIYNPHIIEVTKPVERNEDTNQLKILKNKLRIRIEPSLNGAVLDFAVKDGIYNDLETKEADGYIWHKIAENNWLAQVDGYVELLPKVEYKVGDIVTLKEPIQYYQIASITNDEVILMPKTTLDKIKK